VKNGKKEMWKWEEEPEAKYIRISYYSRNLIIGFAKEKVGD
jgi:hypothetical protein